MYLDGLYVPMPRSQLAFYEKLTMHFVRSNRYAKFGSVQFENSQLSKQGNLTSKIFSICRPWKSSRLEHKAKKTAASAKPVKARNGSHQTLVWQMTCNSSQWHASLDLMMEN